MTVTEFAIDSSAVMFSSSSDLQSINELSKPLPVTEILKCRYIFMYSVWYLMDDIS